MRVRLDKIRSEVIGDPTEIQQVLLNLCTNAFHAMHGSGGVLEVSLQEKPVGDESAPPIPNLSPGRYAVLTVADSGHGMDESTVRRIFEPYFTTKPVGEGTGIGLSTVHGIVRAMGGAVHVESAPGRGSRFNVFFPLPGKRPPAGRPPSGPADESPEKEVTHGADSRRGR
jgi:signal transduction histidine kinase